MISYNSDNDLFTVTAQGDTDPLPNPYRHLYNRSRCMVTLKRNDDQALTVFAVKVWHYPGNFFVYYYSDPQGVLEMPLSDIVTQNLDAGYIDLRLTVDMYDPADLTTPLDSSTNVQFFIHRGISYYDMCPPPCVERFPHWPHIYVYPPNVMHNPSMLNVNYFPGIIVESNFGQFAGSADMEIHWEQTANGETTVVTPTGDRLNQLELSPYADSIAATDGFDSNVWQIEQDPKTCNTYACCQWTSLTGATRRHCFPIVAFANGVDETVSLVSAGNGYRVAKNAYKSIRCRLTGLTAYSLWYYSDIIQANDLHVIVNRPQGDFATEMASSETLAYVDANKVETPEGLGFHNFEFTIKLKHYDTL